MRILDSDLRLITPTDPEGRDTASDCPSQAEPGQRYFQLTHDYLVHSLRNWLARKQKETRRGRAQLRLADRSAVWNARPENRQLPSVFQWVNIRLLTRKKNWTDPQRKMMGAAFRFHLVRGLVLWIVMGVVGWFGYEQYRKPKADTVEADRKARPGGARSRHRVV